MMIGTSSGMFFLVLSSSSVPCTCIPTHLCIASYVCASVLFYTNSYMPSGSSSTSALACPSGSLPRDPPIKMKPAMRHLPASHLHPTNSLVLPIPPRQLQQATRRPHWVQITHTTNLALEAVAWRMTRGSRHSCRQRRTRAPPEGVLLEQAQTTTIKVRRKLHRLESKVVCWSRSSNAAKAAAFSVSSLGRHLGNIAADTAIQVRNMADTRLRKADTVVILTSSQGTVAIPGVATDLEAVILHKEGSILRRAMGLLPGDTVVAWERLVPRR